MALISTSLRPSRVERGVPVRSEGFDTDASGARDPEMLAILPAAVVFNSTLQIGEYVLRQTESGLSFSFALC